MRAFTYEIDSLKSSWKSKAKLPHINEQLGHPPFREFREFHPMFTV